MDFWLALSEYAEKHQTEYPDGRTAVNKITEHACADLMVALGRYIEPDNNPRSDLSST